VLPIICSSCKESVPYDADACPHCGAENTEEKKAVDRTLRYVGSALSGAVIFALLGYFVLPGGLCAGGLAGLVVGLAGCFAHLKYTATR
jgi:hypothetical protein